MGAKMADFSRKQRKQIDQAAEVLQPGEIVLDVTTGMIEATRMGSKKSRNGAILVTDRRVIFYTKKMFGYEMYDHVYGLLTAIDYKKGMMSGSITLAASGAETCVSQIPKDDVERVAKAMRERMAGAHEQGQHGPGAPVNAADEIRKFSELHDAGILTDDEFTAKKKQLLGL
jgi:Bacterial PH domain/Short C-terminal domain